MERELTTSGLQPAFEYLKSALDPSTEVHQRILDYPTGAFEKVAVSEDMFALEQVFVSKDREDCFIEAHKNYVDLQLIISGIEQMEHIDVDKLEVETAYDADKDLIIFKSYDKASKIVLQAGDLAIFFPDDAHIGMPKFETPSLVHKTVVKVPIKYFEK